MSLIRQALRVVLLMCWLNDRYLSNTEVFDHGIALPNKVIGGKLFV